MYHRNQDTLKREWGAINLIGLIAIKQDFCKGVSEEIVLNEIWIMKVCLLVGFCFAMLKDF